MYYLTIVHQMPAPQAWGLDEAECMEQGARMARDLINAPTVSHSRWGNALRDVDLLRQRVQYLEAQLQLLEALSKKARGEDPAPGPDAGYRP